MSDKKPDGKSKKEAEWRDAEAKLRKAVDIYKLLADDKGDLKESVKQQCGPGFATLFSRPQAPHPTP